MSIDRVERGENSLLLILRQKVIPYRIFTYGLLINEENTKFIMLGVLLLIFSLICYKQICFQSRIKPELNFLYQNYKFYIPTIPSF